MIAITTKLPKTVLRIAGDITQAVVRPDLADANSLTPDEILLENTASEQDITVEELLLIHGATYGSVIVWKKGGATRVKLSWQLRHSIRNPVILIA